MKNQMFSIKGTTKGEDIFINIVNQFEKLELLLKKLPRKKYEWHK